MRSPDVADAFCLTFAGGEFVYLSPRQTHAISDYDPLNPFAREIWEETARFLRNGNRFFYIGHDDSIWR